MLRQPAVADGAMDAAIAELGYYPRHSPLQNRTFLRYMQGRDGEADPRNYQQRLVWQLTEKFATNGWVAMNYNNDCCSPPCDTPVAALTYARLNDWRPV